MAAKKKKPKVVKEIAGQICLQVLDNGEEKIFADFRSPQGTRIKLVELAQAQQPDPAADPEKKD